MAMRNLTKKMRLEVYNRMLNILKDYYNREGFFYHGYCWILPDVIDFTEYNTEIQYFPELYKRKPPRSQWVGAYWFSRDANGTLKRIALLEDVIAKMKEKMK